VRDLIVANEAEGRVGGAMSGETDYPSYVATGGQRRRFEYGARLRDAITDLRSDLGAVG
jgi:hypothetical protein